MHNGWSWDSQCFGASVGFFKNLINCFVYFHPSSIKKEHRYFSSGHLEGIDEALYIACGCGLTHPDLKKIMQHDLLDVNSSFIVSFLVIGLLPYASKIAA